VKTGNSISRAWSGAWAVARRELSAYFRQPAGWIIVALYLLLCGAVFSVMVLAPARPATMRPFFDVAGWLLLPVVPAVAMRLFAEEYRTGTIEPLATSPASSLTLVLGKYAGGAIFLACMFAPTLVYPALLTVYSDPAPDLGPIATGYLSLALVAGLYLAVGIAASAGTSNATLAFMTTLFVVLGFLLAGWLGRSLDDPWRSMLYRLSIPSRTGDFAKGIIDTSHVVFFGGAIAWCLALTVGIVQWRRWR